MTLSIVYVDGRREILEDVRLWTVYPHAHGEAEPELVVHFNGDAATRRILLRTFTYVCSA